MQHQLMAVNVFGIFGEGYEQRTLPPKAGGNGYAFDSLVTKGKFANESTDATIAECARQRE